jgi:heptosyltransferase-2
VYLSEFVISADTGILHVADLFQVSGLALIGPTAFGHPTGSSLRVLERNLSCMPCTKDGRGKCSDSTYQRCMVEITPRMVATEVESYFSKNPNPSSGRKRVLL